MRTIRCRRGEACGWKGCDYLHPWDPAWAAAKPSKFAQDREDPPRRKDSGFNLTTSTNAVPVAEGAGAKRWGRPSERGGAGAGSESWNFKSKTSSRAPEPSASWGGWDSKPARKDVEPAKGNASGSSKPDSGGWGATGSGWGSDVAGGWGSGAGWGSPNANETLSEGWGALIQGNTSKDDGKSPAALPAASSPTVVDSIPKTQVATSDAWAASKPPASPLNASNGFGNTSTPNNFSAAVPNDPWGASSSSAAASSSTNWGQSSWETPTTPSKASDPQPRQSTDWASITLSTGNAKPPGRRQSREISEPLKDTKGKGKAKAFDGDIVMREPGLMLPPPVPPRSASFATSTFAEQQQLPPLRVDPSAKAPATINSPLYAPSSASSPAIQPKIPGKLYKRETSMISVAKDDMPRKPKIDPAKEKRSRGELYRSALRHMQNAVILHIDFTKAQADVNRWKETQSSAIYHRATKGARNYLDAQRHEYNNRLGSTRDILKKEIYYLSLLPDFSTYVPPQVNLLTKEMVAQYSQELRDWFQDLELNKRLKKEEEPIVEEPPAALDLPPLPTEAKDAEPPENITPLDDDEEDEDADTSLAPSILATRQNWTWKELLEAADTVERLLSDLEADHLFEAFTNLQDDNLSDLANKLVIDDEVEVLDVHTEDIKDASQAAVKSGEKLSTQAKELEALVKRAADLQREVDEVSKERKYFESVKEKAQKYCVQFEEWETQDNARIQALTDEMRVLHLSRRRQAALPPPPPADPTTFPSSISKEALIEYCGPVLWNMLRPGLETALADHRSLCIKNQKQLADEFVEEANAVSKQADIVRSLAKEIKEMSPTTLKPTMIPPAQGSFIAPPRPSC